MHRSSIPVATGVATRGAHSRVRRECYAAVLVSAFVIHANLDAEARWVNRSLRAPIAARASYYAALAAALAPRDREVEVWAPAAIDPARLVADPSWRVPAMRVGTPPRADLVWAPSASKAANDRRLAAALGLALPGTQVITEVAALAQPGPWVAKAPWTTAGRDRCLGEGPVTDEQRTRLGRLLEAFGALVVEPWCDRVLDLGVGGIVADAGIEVFPPHGLVTDARGTFLGIDLSPPDLRDEERVQLAAAARTAGTAIAAVGHRGPFAIDAFVHVVAGERRLHALCEINARHTFGTVARALPGITQLGFSSPPPDARVLIAPADDGVVAWISATRPTDASARSPRAPR